MLSISFLLTTFFAVSISATPGQIGTTNLRLIKRINANRSAVDLVKHDQARAAALEERGIAIQNNNFDRHTGNIPVTNVVVCYVAEVGVGSPSTYYDLIIDTGSSNTWVGANKSYKETGTSRNTGQFVSIPYGSAYFFGMEWTDTVALSSGLTIANQSIGVALVSWGLHGADGVLGIGPAGLTKGTLIFGPDKEIPTVTQNLQSEGLIQQEIFSVSLAPTTTVPSTNGELTFGGTDASKYTGTINYVTLTATSPASSYWGINQTITYGSEPILGNAAGVVDTGTTLILLATPAFQAYQSATGATLDSATRLLRITQSQYAALQPLKFNIGSVSYALSANAQIWPRSLNVNIGGTSSSIYLIVNDLGLASDGLQFIAGTGFLERFYSVYDTTNNRMGFAETEYTNAIIN